jgi:hypothetical protein
MSANESLGYACWHGGPADKYLLVIGIEEKAIIRGRDHGKGGHSSDALGNATDLGIYFLRNDGGEWNQIVTFSNIRPYIKILEIIKLPKGYITYGIGGDDNGIAKNNPAMRPVDRICNW